MMLWCLCGLSGRLTIFRALRVATSHAADPQWLTPCRWPRRDRRDRRDLNMFSTSSQAGTFNFAYGSNLSPEQMADRCEEHSTSSEPVAIATLEGWNWFICQRGYANVAPGQPQPEQQSQLASENNATQAAHSQTPTSSGQGKDKKDSSTSAVWGVIFNLSAGDEAALDRCEGHSKLYNPSPRRNPSSDPEEVRRKPFLQDGWCYNKMYLPVTIRKWIQGPERYGISSDGPATATVLVYVDENSLEAGIARPEYVRRMNRGIEQSTALGVPKEWVDNVMRGSIAKESMFRGF
jgi:gamma-glutamylcyclotransferase